MAVPAPQQTDSLDAIGKLHAAFKSGFLDTSDIIDNITVQPSKRRAAVATNEDTISQSAANIEARPANTRRKIAEDTLGADTAGANSGLLGEATAVKRASLRDQMDEFGLSGIERTNKVVKLKNEASLLEGQGEIAKANNDVERAQAKANLGRVQGILKADEDKWTIFSDELHRRANDPAGTKALYEGVLSTAGELDVPAGTLTLPQLAQKVAELRKREHAQALQLMQLGKQKDPMDVASGIRKEFDDSPEVKNFRTVQASFNKLKNAGDNAKPSASDDVSMIFSYMKILDPGARVTDNDYDTIKKTAGWKDQFTTYFEKAKAGNILAPEQRAEILAAGRQAFDGQKKTFANLAERQALLARYHDVPLAHVFTPDDLQYLSDAKPAAPSKKASAGLEEWNFPALNGRPAFRGFGRRNPANPDKIIPVNDVP